MSWFNVSYGDAFPTPMALVVHCVGGLLKAKTPCADVSFRTMFHRRGESRDANPMGRSLSDVVAPVHPEVPEFWDRVAALAIDATVTFQVQGMVLLVAMTLLSPWVHSFSQPFWPWSSFGEIGVATVMLAVAWWRFTTPGLLALKLRVADAGSLDRPAFWQCLVRAVPTMATALTGIWLGLVVFIAGVPDANPGRGYLRVLVLSLGALGIALLPYMPMWFSARHRSLWDRLSRTVVMSTAATAGAGSAANEEDARDSPVA